MTLDVAKCWHEFKSFLGVMSSIEYELPFRGAALVFLGIFLASCPGFQSRICLKVSVEIKLWQLSIK